jgi:signal transduction histidine kinase
MTEPVTSPPPARGFALLSWLRQANTQVAQWAASLSWWRLILLFLLIVIAGNLVVETLNLKHDRLVQTANRKEPVVVTIGGPDGITVTKRRHHGVLPGVPGKAGADSKPDAGAGAGSSDAANPGANPNPNPDTSAGDEEAEIVARKIYTFRGLLGDLGATAMIVLFAYLAAAKIVVRRVAQADARVRSAQDVASREAMERQLVQARLQVLQAQVEPHFLFNTLAAVDYLIETDPPRASQMQKQLITYLRGALPQMRQESSTLGRELRLVRSYLDLIKMRIEERLEIDLQVPPELEAVDFPPMMLQSLVENAVKHGIEPKPEGGRITLTARQQRGMLWVEVRDTGVGLVDTERLVEPPPGSGIGLQNIRERLAMLYPGKGRLTLVSDEGEGTAVTLGVPYKPGAAAEEAAGGEPQGQGA